MSPTLLIMAGGTGGHIMPGLAIARAMKERGWQVRWLGTAHGMENRLVPEAGIGLDTIEFSGLRGKGAAHTLRGIGLLFKGFWRSIGFVRRLRPDAVLGMGGYVTVPGGVAAALLHRPLVLMNSDATPLLSNRILMPLAERVLFGLPGDARARGPKAIWTGCPIRAEVLAIVPPDERFSARSGPLHVLVVGGSLGAAVLNRTVPLALAKIPVDVRPIVTHQSGAQHVEALKEGYRAAAVEARVVSFIEDMADAYAKADIVVCRAGAITVSELTAAGIASVLVPLTVSTTSHQRANAQYMHDAHAAIHLPQGELTADTLAALLQSLDRTKLLDMARSARALGKPNATESVATVLETVAGKS